MLNDSTITIIVGLGAAIIGAVSVLVVPLIQKKVDKGKLSDKEMFEYWRAAFDRSAFRGPFTWQSDQQRFELAIRDTIQAINSGYSPSQNPSIKGAPKSYLKNKEWLQTMDKVADHLKNITWAISGRTNKSALEISTLADLERDAAINLLNSVLVQLNIHFLDLPTSVTVYYDDKN